MDILSNTKLSIASLFFKTYKTILLITALYSSSTILIPCELRLLSASSIIFSPKPYSNTSRHSPEKMADTRMSVNASNGVLASSLLNELQQFTYELYLSIPFSYLISKKRLNESTLCPLLVK